MDAYHILVIVLSTVLALILAATLVAILIFIKIIKDIRHITQKASMASDSIEHAANLFKSTTSIAAVTKVVGNAMEMFAHKRSKKEK